MASAITHVVVAGALGAALQPEQRMPARYWLLAAACSAGPDLDVIGFWAGIPYGHMLGHRGLTHSLPFAALVALLVVGLAFRDPRWREHRTQLWIVFFCASASHGLLDMLTDGGLGVALFAPFDSARYFFGATPIPVSPLSISAFVSGRGAHILAVEVLWIWLPALLLAVLARRRAA